MIPGKPKLKFKKVYSGPGYPIDPQLEKARGIEAYVNIMTLESARPSRAYDYASLNRWLAEQLN